MVSSQQGLCYTRSSLPITVEDKYYSPYRPDTRPGEFISTEEVKNIKELLISTLDQLDDDYSKGVFKAYQAFDNRYGVRLSDIDSAIDFLPFHDGLHGGFITALKRLVNS